MRFEFAGETLSCLHMFWNAGLLAASETGGAARLNIRRAVDGELRISVLCPLSSVF